MKYLVFAVYKLNNIPTRDLQDMIRGYASVGGSSNSLQIAEASVVFPLPVAPVISKIPWDDLDNVIEVEPLLLRHI